MKRLAICLGLAVLICLPGSFGMAQETAADVMFKFQTVNFPGDNFTQLLGVNNSKVIAGYHGSGATNHPNVGFVLTLPNTFTIENFPGAVQTQVIGINNGGTTDGFYIDTAGINHGFLDFMGSFTTVDFPGTKFNQLLGLNGEAQFAGFYNDSTGASHGYIYVKGRPVFLALTIPAASLTAVSGVNNSGEICGFFKDSSGTHGFTLNLGTFKKLGFPGASSTMALGLNNKGWVVGTYTDTSGLVHGFIYQGGTFTSVDDPSGIGATMINGINDNAVIVGFFGNCTTGGVVCNGFVGTPIM